MHQSGIAVPFVQAELMTIVATAGEHWAASASSKDLLIGDCLWGSTGYVPPYIAPCWNEAMYLRYQLTLKQTGTDAVGLSKARYVRQCDDKSVCRRAITFTSRAEVDLKTDGSVTIDVRRLIDDNLRVGMRTEVAKLGRFNQGYVTAAGPPREGL